MLKPVMRACVGSLLSASVFISTAAYADTYPDDHAPIGVMGEHNHKMGEWMLSYRYSRMEMKGNRDGTRNLSAPEVLNNFMVTPLDMRMEMHMLGAMYGVSNRLTVMGMVPYVRKSMGHVTGGGVHFNTNTQGMGDSKLTGLFTMYESDNARHTGGHDSLLLNAGLSLPTGSIDERDNTPAAANQKLPYPMQLGSGTVDPLFGLTYNDRYVGWSWGMQANTVLRFGKNSEGYRLGNEYGLTAWVSKEVSRWASLSLRLDGKSWGNIHGRDTDLNPMMVPTARPDLRGGRRLDALVGVNLYQPDGALSGHRLAIELGAPVYQRLDGPQLQTDTRLIIGWQKQF